MAGSVWKFPLEARAVLGLVGGKAVVRRDRLHFQCEDRACRREMRLARQQRNLEVHAGGQQNHKTCKGILPCTSAFRANCIPLWAPCLEEENSHRNISSERQVESEGSTASQAGAVAAWRTFDQVMPACVYRH